MQNSPSSILLVKTSSLGDVIQTFPVLQYLRSRFPQVTIDWVVEKQSVSLLSACSLISNVIAIDTKAWRSSLSACRGLLEVITHLRSKNYDLLFDLQGNTKSACVTLLAKSKEKIGFDSNHIQERINLLATTRKIPLAKKLNAQMKYLQLVQRYFNDSTIFIPKPVSIKLTLSEENRLKSLLSAKRLNRPLRFMVAAHSRWPNKEMQMETLCSLLTYISSQCDACFIFVYHTAAEKQLSDYMEQKFQQRSLSVGGLSVPLWQNLMDKMNGVISVDSAALHLCATTTTPSFSIFGPSLADCYRPIGSQHFSVQGICPYRLQFQSRCPLLRKCATGACLKNLNTNHLISTCSDWLTKIKSILQ